MSTTERKLFSYDLEEDADIHKFLNQLPKRQQSKYIRMALRLLKEKFDQGDIAQSRAISPDTTRHITNEEATVSSEDNDDFEDMSDDMLNLGK
ncbi:hypothetical protein [Halobacillus amylolyticus]|uniref:Uncharacterized protein n=1 Tax=Halobacillus amylolyticus TaxID=2932259 RepID=A0ABY4HGS8_9BACI|nr:hypothetical protein [Halobacillus amylolyticus]UOR14093.1 hypothetical protein MUO15_21290 [Halobacillus amylolyticus]